MEVNIPDVHTFILSKPQRGSEYMLLAAISMLCTTEEHKQETIEEIWEGLREMVQEMVR